MSSRLVSRWYSFDTVATGSKKLDDTLKDIEQSFGSGAIMRLDEQAKPTEVISTGAKSLDDALGVGGLPTGRVTEIYGAEGVGKSSLVLHCIAEAQKLGPCALIDAEHSFDLAYAKAIGVDTDSLLIAQPTTSEESWEISQKLAPNVVLLAIDSLAVLLPLAELDGEAGEAHMGLKARQIGQAMRRLVPIVHQHNTTLILVNQVREKIGIVFGSPIAVPGGRAPKFAASIRIECKKGEKQQGKQEIKFAVVKNKVAPPYGTATAWIVYGKGIVDKRAKGRKEAL